MKFEVLTYGNPILRKKSIPIKKIDDALKRLAKDMLAALYEARGVGLAAQQIGRTESLCVIDIPAEMDSREKGGPRDNPHIRMPLVLMNPRVIAAAGEQSNQEGCLSFPEIFVTMIRPYEVTVAFMGMDNRDKIETVRGLLARAVLHEIDHLAGVLLVDRMTAVQKLTVAAKLRRLKRASKAKQAASP